jgi:hypothetical protein
MATKVDKSLLMVASRQRLGADCILKNGGEQCILRCCRVRGGCMAMKLHLQMLPVSDHAFAGSFLSPDRGQAMIKPVHRTGR